jgi:hypothetical protein
MDYTVSDDAAWLTVTPSSGTAPGTLTASVAQGALTPGTYNALITVLAPGASGSPKIIPVTFVINAISGDTIDVPLDAGYHPDVGEILVWDGDNFTDGTLA